MKHNVNAANGLPRCVAIEQVPLDQLDASFFECAGKMFSLPAREVIHNTHPRALRHQRVHQSRADKRSPARHQHPCFCPVDHHIFSVLFVTNPSRASRHSCLSFRFRPSPRQAVCHTHRRRTQSPHSRSRRCSHFFCEHSRRLFRLPVFPAFSRHQPAGRSRHSEQRPAPRQQESRQKRLLRRNDRRIQHFHRRNLFCFLHLGHFVLLSQQLIHRLLDLGLPEKIGVGHSEQRELPNRRIQIIRFHVRTVAAHLLQFRL